MKTRKFQIIDLNPTNDGNYAFITKGADIPALKVSKTLVESICERAIGIRSIPSLKSLIKISNGAAVVTVDAKDLKAGDAWTNENTGETGTYSKDWTQFSNYRLELGTLANMKVAEMTFSHALNGLSNAAPVIEQVKASKTEPVVESNNEDEAPNA